jgi:mono/diheme cytochrome c family protein
MNRNLGRASLLALALACGGNAGLAQTAPPPASPSPVAPRPAVAPPPSAVPVVMTMGDLMNTLVQPRHEKLGLAGQAQNWPLAKYALEQLRAALANVASAKPKFAGFPVGELVDLALTPPFNAVDAAIKQQDAQKFATAYAQVTQGCNACHIELNHAYVVIKAPDASAFPDQDFAPKR